MRISFINQKGGVGKTTACIAVAAVLKQAGLNVCIDDRDPQGSARFWATEVGGIPLADENEWNFVLCDTPGHLFDADSSRREDYWNLIEQSDVLVIVTEKTLFGFHSTVALVRALREKTGPDTRIFLLLNKVRPQTRSEFPPDEEVASRLGIHLLQPGLPLAVCFEHMQASGIQALKKSALGAVVAIAKSLVSSDSLGVSR